MSNILKGIINETSPHDYDSDWDYQDAVARSGKSRSSYRSQEDDTFDADVAYSKKMYQLGQQQKAAKEKAQRDSDHDRLATGTNESFNPYEPVMIQGYDKWLKLVNIPNVDKHAYKSDITAVTSLGDVIGEFNTDKDLGYVIKKYVKKGMSEAGTGLDIDRSIPGRTIARISGTSPDPAIGKLRRNPHAKKLSDFNDSDEYDQWSGKVGPSIHDDEEDTFDTDYTGDEDGTLKEISNEKLAQYKTAAALDAGKADKEGDYKRGDKRFSGIVKATKKQFANDTKKSGISQGINEFSPGATGPKGPKDYGQPNSSRYIGGNKFVVGTTNNYVLTATIDKWGLEWDEDDEIWFLDSPGAAHIADASEGEIELPPPREQRNQIHDLVTDYLNERNSADLQKVAAYYGHSNDGEMATNEAVSANRFNSKQEVINHFVKNGKSAAAGAAAWERGYRGSSKKPIELKKSPQKSYHDELDDKRYSTFETVGDHLKSTALDVLVKAKLEIERHREAIEKQHEAEGEAYKQDLIKNNASRLPKQNIKTFQPIPVLKPDENPDVLRDRLQHLDIAKQKFQELNELIDAIKDKYPLVADKLNQLDNSLLQDVKDGPADNYKTLLIKLTQYKSDLGKKYPTAVAYLAKKNKQGVDEDNNSGRMRMKDYYELADAIQEKLRHAIQMGDKARIQELNKQRDELDARVKKHGMMPEDVSEEKQRLDPKCWTGYKKQGTKMKGDTRVNNCVPVKETKSHILAGLQQIDEGWKDKLGAAALAGSMALGAAGANADTRRVTPDGQGGFTGGMKPTATVQAEPAPATPSTTTIPGQGLVRAERADRQAGTVTVNGQEYKMIMLEPGGIRPRGGQQIAIPLPVMGERGLGNYIGILAGGRVFVLPNND